MQTFYPTLGNQARRVAGPVPAMGQRAELTPDQQQTLEISAYIHDIGLVGVPRQLIKRWQESPRILERRRAAPWFTIIPILGQELAGFVHHLQSRRPHHPRPSRTF